MVALRHEILFVDSVVVTEEPRIAPHVAAMRGRIAERSASGRSA